MASIAEGDGWLLVVGKILILKWNSTSLLHPHDIPLTPHEGGSLHSLEAKSLAVESGEWIQWIPGSWWLA